MARTTRIVALTEDGRSLLPHARRLLDDSIEARGVLKNARQGASGLLPVSATSTFGRVFLAPYLPAFRQRHPNVRVSLRLLSAKAGVGVGEGHVDIAVRPGPVVEPNLGVQKLGQIEFILVANPAYTKGRQRIVELIDLSKHDLIELRPPAVDNRLDLHRRSKVFSLRCVPAIETDDPEPVRHAVPANGGIATLPNFLA